MEQIGPYELLDKLGSGGMGTVYHARHAETGQIVALKVMRTDVADDPLFLRRFQREAEIARSLKSPHIVETLDAGIDGETRYIAMELVEGESLASRLRRAGPLPYEQAVDLAIQVARGLEVAHARGVVHRDISPQNILIAPDGTAKIADFGIARSDASTALTATAAFVGKPAYAAPETYAGQIDARSDIYSLGVVLFEMLSGRTVFLAPTPMALMQMHIHEPPPSLSALGVRVPGSLENVMRTCLSKNPNERFQTPAALINALEQAPAQSKLTAVLPSPRQGDETVAMTPGGSGILPTRPKPGHQFWRQSWFLIGAGGMAIAAALAFVVLSGVADRGENASSPSPSSFAQATDQPPGTPTLSPSPDDPITPSYLAPSGYPIDPGTTTLHVVGTRGSRSLEEGGPTVRDTSERIQLQSFADTADSSGWGCDTHVEFLGQPGVDWYLPPGTPVLATMDGTATVYVNTVTNTFAHYGVSTQPYLGNPAPNAAVDPFAGQPNGGKGVWVEVRNDRFTVNAAHLDLGRMVNEAIPSEAYLPGYSGSFDFASVFGVPQAFTQRTSIANWAVRKGDLIGYTGSSGYAEGPQIHFEILRTGSTSKLCPTIEPGYSDSGWLANTDPMHP